MTYTPRERAEARLGKAADPRALDRLFELWPGARVEVRHKTVYRGVPFSADRIPLRCTTVEVWEGEKNDEPGSWADVNFRHVLREAVCHSGDRFVRRTGVELAFRKCLQAVRERSA